MIFLKRSDSRLTHTVSSFAKSRICGPCSSAEGILTWCCTNVMKSSLVPQEILETLSPGQIKWYYLCWNFHSLLLISLSYIMGKIWNKAAVWLEEGKMSFWTSIREESWWGEGGGARAETSWPTAHSLKRGCSSEVPGWSPAGCSTAPGISKYPRKHFPAYPYFSPLCLLESKKRKMIFFPDLQFLSSY